MRNSRSHDESLQLSRVVEADDGVAATTVVLVGVLGARVGVAWVFSLLERREWVEGKYVRGTASNRLRCTRSDGYQGGL